MAKIIKYNTEARNLIKAGVDQLADAVKVTLGSRRTVSPSPKRWSSRTSSRTQVLNSSRV